MRIFITKRQNLLFMILFRLVGLLSAPILPNKHEIAVGSSDIISFSGVSIEDKIYGVSRDGVTLCKFDRTELWQNTQPNDEVSCLLDSNNNILLRFTSVSTRVNETYVLEEHLCPKGICTGEHVPLSTLIIEVKQTSDDSLSENEQTKSIDALNSSLSENELTKSFDGSVSGDKIARTEILLVIIIVLLIMIFGVLLACLCKHDKRICRLELSTVKKTQFLNDEGRPLCNRNDAHGEAIEMDLSQNSLQSVLKEIFGLKVMVLDTIQSKIEGCFKDTTKEIKDNLENSNKLNVELIEGIRKDHKEKLKDVQQKDQEQLECMMKIFQDQLECPKNKHEKGLEGMIGECLEILKEIRNGYKKIERVHYKEVEKQEKKVLRDTKNRSKQETNSKTEGDRSTLKRSITIRNEPDIGNHTCSSNSFLEYKGFSVNLSIESNEQTNSARSISSPARVKSSEKQPSSEDSENTVTYKELVSVKTASLKVEEGTKDGLGSTQDLNSLNSECLIQLKEENCLSKDPVNTTSSANTTSVLLADPQSSPHLFKPLKETSSGAAVESENVKKNEEDMYPAPQTAQDSGPS